MTLNESDRYMSQNQSHDCTLNHFKPEVTVDEDLNFVWIKYPRISLQT